MAPGNLAGDALDGFVQWLRDVGRRRILPGSEAELEPDLRVADDLLNCPISSSMGMSREHSHIQVAVASGGNHVVPESGVMIVA